MEGGIGGVNGLGFEGVFGRGYMWCRKGFYRVEGFWGYN